MCIGRIRLWKAPRGNGRPEGRYPQDHHSSASRRLPLGWQMPCPQLLGPAAVARPPACNAPPVVQHTLRPQPPQLRSRRMQASARGPSRSAARRTPGQTSPHARPPGRARTRSHRRVIASQTRPTRLVVGRGVLRDVKAQQPVLRLEQRHLLGGDHPGLAPHLQPEPEGGGLCRLHIKTYARCLACYIKSTARTSGATSSAETILGSPRT